MIYALAILAALAMLHLAYESIIAPSLRLSLKYKLFALRDRARRLKMQAGEAFSDRHFDDLQRSLNLLIGFVDSLDIGLILHMKREVDRDPELSKRLEARSRALDGCTLPEAQAIRKESVRLSLITLTINSAAWVIYLVPVIVALICYSEVTKLLRSLLALAEPDVTKIAARSARMPRTAALAK